MPQATSSNNLVLITSASNLLVSGVTVANSSHEHLVLEGDTNVTVSNVDINDNYTVAQTGGYLSNTDGLDYSGSHFLIQGCNINDGDDDIPPSRAVLTRPMSQSRTASLARGTASRLADKPMRTSMA